MADIPFVPKEWTRLKDLAGDDVFPKYAEIFLDSQYNGIGWGDYYREFKRLREVNALENELPEINEERRERQREK